MFVSILIVVETGHPLRNCAHGCAPGDGDVGGLLGLDELLAGVGALSTLVGLAEHGGQDLVMVSVSCGLTGGRGAHAHRLSQWSG